MPVPQLSENVLNLFCELPVRRTEYRLSMFRPRFRRLICGREAAFGAGGRAPKHLPSLRGANMSLISAFIGRLRRNIAGLVRVSAERPLFSRLQSG